MSQQIGWSQEAKLLYQIKQQIKRLSQITASNFTTTTTSTTSSSTSTTSTTTTTP